MTSLLKIWARNHPIAILSLIFIGLVHLSWLLPFAGIEAAPELFGAPLVPGLVGLGVWVTGWSVGLVKTKLVILSLLINPMFLYLMIRNVTQRRTAALMAAFLINLPWWWGEIHFNSALVYGDAAHIIGLMLIPLAGSGLLNFLRTGRFRWYILTVLTTAALGLTSSFATLMFLFFGMVVTFSEVLLGFGRLKLLRFFSLMLGVIGLVAFWYNPFTLREILVSTRGQEAIVVLNRLLPLSLVIAPILGSIGFILFDKRPSLQPLFLALGIVAVYLLFYLSGISGEHLLASEPQRFLPELSLAVAFLIGIVLDRLLLRYSAIIELRLIALLGLMALIWIITLVAGATKGIKSNIEYSVRTENRFSTEHILVSPFKNVFSAVLGVSITLATAGFIYVLKKDYGQSS